MNDQQGSPRRDVRHFHTGVSVVIPSAGRQSLASAVDSALKQRSVEVEVIVVDNATGSDHIKAPLPAEVVCLRSDPSLGANGARQHGIAEASHRLIALLDDDDVWSPSKLSAQLDLVRSKGLSSEDAWIVGSGVTIYDSHSAEMIRSPRTFETENNGIDVPAYLFRRTTLRDARHQLQSSALLFPAWLAHDVPFRGEVPRHQDWTWLLEVWGRHRPDVYVVGDYLVNYRRGSASSIAANTDPKWSAEWGSRYLADDARVLGDFVATVPVNLALMAGEPSLAVELLRQASRVGAPGIQARLRGWTAVGRAYANRYGAGLRC